MKFQRNNTKRFFIIMLILGIVLTGTIACGVRADNRLVEWNSYKGDMPDYNVSIDESRYANQAGLRVILQAEKKDPEHEYRMTITGHDYDGDGQWDRIFYCGYPDLKKGCNSVNMKTGEFHACPADEGKVQPFTQEEIEYAKATLDQAMASVHNDQYRKTNLADSAAQQ